MVNHERLRRYLKQFATFNDNRDDHGVTRLGYTLQERQAHAFFSREMSKLGAQVYSDNAGNTIAEFAGTRSTAPALACGSHLDSVEHAGRFDGVAGVIAAMEIAHIRASETETAWNHPLKIVVFATEEGARFGQACVGSRIAARLHTSESLSQLSDATGISAFRAMQELGLNPNDLAAAQWQPHEWKAFIELHIEQGPSLDKSGFDAGIVSTISGSTRLSFTFTGVASHSGGTPMRIRRDALAGAAEFLVAAEEYALQRAPLDFLDPGLRITTGQLSVEPGGITTIPGVCTLSVDIRGVVDTVQQECAHDLMNLAHRIANHRQLECTCHHVSEVLPEHLSADVQQVLHDAAHVCGTRVCTMVSGASHDAQIIQRICPSGIVFIPSLNGGVSHSPHELSRVSDLATGVKILYSALRKLDTLQDCGG
ncbi:hydantoinase/carbamoylase family amidase [Corynebacterium poyangense]|uniref:Hydantoinase/carbamoylase family amidase n=1 Tax=Corynebacterium poyangense TaxID=2684405 RepID=A0A7H0SNP1_9CORY|nr:Zn-dependent hydrolase [Corynebacterium poyangense]QNQ90166.1 hydantoinase/carbamoylase family amidase [Corynebacterium poyangense]